MKYQYRYACLECDYIYHRDTRAAEIQECSSCENAFMKFTGKIEVLDSSKSHSGWKKDGLESIRNATSTQIVKDQEREAKIKIKIEPRESYYDAHLKAKVYNDSNKTAYINLATLIEGENRNVHSSELVKIERKATEVWIGEWMLQPNEFKLISTYDRDIYCFRLKFYKGIGHPDFNPAKYNYVVKINYNDGFTELFKTCNIMERDEEYDGSIFEVSLIIRCTNKINLEDPGSLKPAWEKIKDVKKPSLFVIHDWKMDMDFCLIDIKTSRNLGYENSLARIRFKMDASETSDFGLIKENPILYFEYPEGKYTFETIKVIDLQTIIIKGVKFVSYEFQAILTKEELS